MSRRDIAFHDETNRWRWMSASSVPLSEQGPSNGHRVLLIEPDPADAEAFAWAVGLLRVDGCWTSHGSEGLALAQHERFDLVLIDVHLPDVPGVEVVRQLLAHGVPARLLFVSQADEIALSASATQLGALGVLRRPLRTPDLVKALTAVLGLPGPRSYPSPRAAHASMAPERELVTSHQLHGRHGSIARRWAALVMNALAADHDPKTIATWARLAGVSRSVLCECCRLVHVSPHDARDFARLLRAVSRSGEIWQPETVLDLADVRTLRKLLARAGLTGIEARTPTMQEFLARQQWIPASNPGLQALRTLLFGQ